MIYNDQTMPPANLSNRKIAIDAKELSIYEYDENEVVYIECRLQPEKKYARYTGEIADAAAKKVYTAPEKKYAEPATVAEESVPQSAKAVLTLSWIDDETGDQKKLRIDSFPFSIGRKSDDNNYAIRKKGMSRKHMYFEEAGGSVYLIDDNSTNGISLNGTKVEAGKRNKLKDGDVMRTADITFKVSIQ